MNCKQADEAIVRLLFDPSTAEGGQQLEEHLLSCLQCFQRVKTYRVVRDEVARMERLTPPPEIKESLLKRTRAAFERPSQVLRRPADPRPEHSVGQKVLIFIGAVAVLTAMMVGLMLLSGRIDKPQSIVGEITFLSGAVEFRTPGMSRWSPIERGEPLLQGTALRADADALLKVQTQGAQWWLDGPSSVVLAEAGTVELVLGRVYARCDGLVPPIRGARPEGLAHGPVHLVSDNGTVSCTEGEFTASLSPMRLRVGCISGTVLVGNDEGQTQLEGGQRAMLAEGKVSGPLRSGRTADLTHWLKVFDCAERQQRLSLRQLASLPLTPESAALPSAISLESLRVSVTVRGPLALVNAEMLVRNGGAVPWQGRLSAADVLLPGPLAEAGTAVMELQPGQAAKHELTALCLMKARQGFYALAFDPQGWTRSPVGLLQLDVDAKGEGGLEEFNWPMQDVHLRRPDAVQWSWTGRNVGPGETVLLEFKFAEPGGVDSLALASEAGAWAVTAWRPAAQEDRWIAGKRNVFIAFDATADYEPAGRAFAHEVLETVFASLPPGCSTAVIAYDGRVRMDPTPLARHTPARVESMLAGLWKMDGQPEKRAAEFLQTAMVLAAAAEGESLLIFITGRQPLSKAHQVENPAPDGKVRTVVLLVGADEPERAYATFCAESGGVALALDYRMAPWATVLDFLSNLHWPSLRQARIEVQGQAEGAVLPASCTFASQPVVALISMPDGAGALRGSFRAEAAGQQLTAPFELKAGGEVILSGRRAHKLVSALRARIGM